MPSLVIRPARRTDCLQIARLFLMSSDGLAEYIWSQFADREIAPGENETLIDIGAQRYAREGVAFSWQNCLIAERDGRTVGMLHSYVMEPSNGQVEPDPVLRPYSELEDTGSLYVSGLAVYPSWRRNGIGTALLAAAEHRARMLRLPRTSLICFEANETAMRLYRRHGYRETKRRPIHPHPLLHVTGGDAVLMVRPVAPRLAMQAA